MPRLRLEIHRLPSVPLPLWEVRGDGWRELTASPEEAVVAIGRRLGLELPGASSVDVEVAWVGVPKGWEPPSTVRSDGPGMAPN
jgi:hypothetical protein